jgi:hypothetical protein
MGNICEILSKREREKSVVVLATPNYIINDTSNNNVATGIPVTYQQPVQAIPYNNNNVATGIPVTYQQPVQAIPYNNNPIADRFTSGLLSGIILSDLVDDCY